MEELLSKCLLCPSVYLWSPTRTDYPIIKNLGTDSEPLTGRTASSVIFLVDWSPSSQLLAIWSSSLSSRLSLDDKYWIRSASGAIPVWKGSRGLLGLYGIKFNSIAWLAASVVAIISDLLPIRSSQIYDLQAQFVTLRGLNCSSVSPHSLDQYWRPRA